MMSCGAVIKRARLDKGLSQGALADKVGVSKASIYSWEKGRFAPTDANNICALEAALGFANGYLYSLLYPNPTRPPADTGESKAVQNA